MSKNIGFSKKHATALAKSCCTSKVDAYPQRQEHFVPSFCAMTHQWIVVLQKKAEISKEKL